MNVIAAEFAKRCDKASKALESEKDNTATREEDDVDVEASESGNNEVATKGGEVPMGKHYMVFMTTTWSSEGRPFAFIAARHCLSSLSGRWIRVNKRQITCALALYGFVVNANSFDGATENRSAMNQDLTLTLKQVLPEFLDAEGINKEASNVCEDGCDDDVSSSLPCDDDIQQYLKDEARHPDRRVLQRYKEHELPWEMEVAYPHPICKGVLIAAAADMPHGVKTKAPFRFIPSLGLICLTRSRSRACDLALLPEHLARP